MDNTLARIIRVGIAVILVLVPLLYSSQTQNSFGVPKRVFFQIAISLLLVVFSILIAAAPGRLAQRRTPADLVLLAWLAWTAISSIRSIDRAESMQVLVYYACLAALFLLITRCYAAPVPALAPLALIAVLAFAEACYGIAEWKGMKLLYESNIKELTPTFETSAWRWTILGTFGNAYHLASYLALCCPMLVGIILALGGWRRWAAFSALLPVLACLMLTGARGSWLAAAVGMLLALCFSVRLGLRVRAWAVVLAAAVIVLLCAVSLVIAPGISRDFAERVGAVFTKARNILTVYTDEGYASRVEAQLTDATSSLSYRILAWRLTLRMIAARPLFGSGPGTFKLLFLPTLADHLKGHDPISYWPITEKMNEPHNEFLQMAAESGLPGLVLFLLFCVCVLRAARAQAFALPTPERFLCAGMAAAFITVLVDALSSIPFHVVPTFVAFWAVAALLCPLPEAPSAAPAVRPVWRWASPFYLIAFACIAAYTSVRELSFEYYFKAATGLTLAQKYVYSLPFFETARRIHPSSGQLLFYYGSTLVQIGHNAEGAAMLERAMDMNFKDIYLYKNLGIAYDRMGREEKAVEQYERWRDMGIAAHEANNLIGLIRLRQGRRREAAEIFKDTLRVRRWDWPAYLSLANILMEDGRHEEALRALDPEPFATGDKSNPEAFSVYGLALLNAGRHAEAERYFVRTLELDPKSVRAHNNLAAIYYATGRKERALREWEMVLGLDPDNQVAKSNLEIARSSSPAGSGSP